VCACVCERERERERDSKDKNEAKKDYGIILANFRGKIIITFRYDFI
jgi:hypothetical protein